MRDLLSRLFPKFRKGTTKLLIEQRVEELESQVEKLREVLGSILIRADGATRKASFVMIVQQVFKITGRGSVVVGSIEKGTVSVGDRILVDSPGWSLPATVQLIEKYQEKPTQASVGENVGIMLEGLSHEQILAAVLLRSADA